MLTLCLTRRIAERIQKLQPLTNQHLPKKITKIEEKKRISVLIHNHRRETEPHCISSNRISPFISSLHCGPLDPHMDRATTLTHSTHPSPSASEASGFYATAPSVSPHFHLVTLAHCNRKRPPANACFLTKPIFGNRENVSRGVSQDGRIMPQNLEALFLNRPGQQMKTGESAMQATPEETGPET